MDSIIIVFGSVGIVMTFGIVHVAFSFGRLAKSAERIATIVEKFEHTPDALSGLANGMCQTGEALQNIQRGYNDFREYDKNRTS